MTHETGRLCRIYKGSRRRDCYLYVDRRDDLEQVPESLLEQMGTLTRVMDLMLTPDRRLARVEASRVLDQIRERGYFVQMPPGEEAGGIYGPG